ncbi:MAG: hypothetical protein M1546_25275 [Chloroflexi bacterium]|nr:hypothetical protein [Chloroflexota bacterium]
MYVRNRSRYPTGEVQQLLAVAAEGIDTADVEVHIRNSKGCFSGTAFFARPRRLRLQPATRWLIVARIGVPDRFPILQHHYPGLKTAPRYDIMNWCEAVVLIVAHELRHVQQFRARAEWISVQRSLQPRTQVRPSGEARFSEVVCERWAVARLHRA